MTKDITGPQPSTPAQPVTNTLFSSTYSLTSTPGQSSESSPKTAGAEVASPSSTPSNIDLEKNSSTNTTAAESVEASNNDSVSTAVNTAPVATNPVESVLSASVTDTPSPTNPTTSISSNPAPVETATANASNTTTIAVSTADVSTEPVKPVFSEAVKDIPSTTDRKKSISTNPAPVEPATATTTVATTKSTSAPQKRGNLGSLLQVFKPQKKSEKRFQ
ncbi:hypothetical protein BJ508DRAFT_336721 [Ascobolus immersus RN42]|uniref:Uncharacterized protein n=1 Tax=Ascobolus immersus RN42 TaxID=1160509 RepID=A0A3N4HFA3_ASCIM|nr:hypothetical protein BJ508DRAFT_336721 [Ascobolus immersus RN42]